MSLLSFPPLLRDGSGPVVSKETVCSAAAVEVRVAIATMDSVEEKGQ
jgi:hypothetical protein